MSRAVQVDVLLAGIRDANGNQLAAGKVYFYSPGTTSLKDVYTDVNKSSVSANPVILDSSGRKQIYADGAYKLLVKDADNNIVYTWDNLRFFFPDGRVFWGGTSSGSASTLAITVSPSITALEAGDFVRFISHVDCATGVQINVNSLGNKAIKKEDGSKSLLAGDIILGQLVTLIYDGTNFVYENYTNSGQFDYTPTVNCSGSMTIGSTGINYAKYSNIGSLIDFNLDIQAILGGTADSFIYVTVPVTALAALDDVIRFPSAILNGGNWAFSQATLTASGTKFKFPINALDGNWTLGAVRVRTSGQYRYSL